MFDATAHDYAEGQKTKRAIVRKSHGLDMDDSPYLPSNQSMVTNNQSAGWLGILVGAFLALTGLVIGGGIMYLGQGSNKPAATNTLDVPAPVEFDQVEQSLQPNGEWKPTGKTARIRTMPNGTVQTRQPDGSWR